MSKPPEAPVKAIAENAVLLPSIGFQVMSEDITMRLLPEEKVERLTSGGNAIHLALATFMAGIVVSLTLALVTSAIAENIRWNIKIALWVFSILTVYFSAMAYRDWWNHKELKRKILKGTRIATGRINIQSIQDPQG